ncbi:hypothetical protein AB0L53_46660 [Nonomuraea sp. NPDC052129]|uniref:NACHT domain-containing protein n=1 Tax=Nonomuraea sp. NPDC052129 TaxID=3154651 RepID=UPI0034246B11
MYKHRRWLLWTTGCLGTAAVLVLAWQFLVKGLDEADALASVLSGGFAALSLILAVATALARPGARTTSPEQLAQAEQALADSALRQWNDEAVARGALNIVPARVGWEGQPPRRGKGSGWRSSRPNKGGPRKFERYREEILQNFQRVPGRRLVITGDRGSGKSIYVLLLTLGLLARRQRNESFADHHREVPVLLTLAQWEPGVEKFTDWVERRLTETYSFLLDTQNYGGTAARSLVQSPRLLLILDGLDEIDAAVRHQAIIEIDNAVPVDRPLVVTCRTVEYDQSVQAGTSFTGAVEWRLVPLTPGEASRYLLDNGAGRPDGPWRQRRRETDDGGWDRVLRRLAAHSPSPVKSVLTIPLYVSIARHVYLNQPDAAREMTDTARFPNPESLKAHLLNEFVVRAFQRSGHEERERIAERWRHSPTHGWLRDLAATTRRLGGHRFAWWLQHRSLEERDWSLIVSVVSAAIYGLTDSFPNGLRHGIAVGMSLGLLIGLTRGRLSGVADGVRTGITIGGCVLLVGLPMVGLTQAITDGIELGLALGGSVALMRRLTSSLRAVHGVSVMIGAAVGIFMGIRYGFSEGLVYGLMKGLTAFLGMTISVEFSAVLTSWLGTGKSPRQPTRLNFGISGRTRTLAFHLVVGTVSGLVIGLGGGLIGFLRAWAEYGLDEGAVYGARVGVSYGLTAGLAIGLTGGAVRWLSEASPTKRAESPRSTLRTARIVALTYITVPTVLAAFCMDILGTLSAGLVHGGYAETGVSATAFQGAALGFCIGLVLATSFTPWPTFAAVKLMSFLKGRAPLRLMSFLEDAYRLEILRQDGAGYQFRHSELEQYLAGSRLPGAAP